MKIPITHAPRLLSPRLVILVTTVDEKGRINGAPYSFCGPLEFSPPLVYFAARPYQDTYKNIKKTREFVINVVSEDFAQKAVSCEKKLPYGVNELEEVGLHWTPSKKVKPPRVKESKLYLECKSKKEFETGGSHIIIIGEIVHAGCDSMKDGLPDLLKIRPVMHVGGDTFYTVGKKVKLKRG